MKKLKIRTSLILDDSENFDDQTVQLFFEGSANSIEFEFCEEAISMTLTELQNNPVQYLVADVSKAIEVAHSMDETRVLMSQINFFFKAASIHEMGKPVSEFPEAGLNQMIALNVKGIYHENTLVLPKMKEGSSIIMTCSVASIMHFANLIAYGSSKYAVLGIVQKQKQDKAGRRYVDAVYSSSSFNRIMDAREEESFSGYAAGMKTQFDAALSIGRNNYRSEMLNSARIHTFDIKPLELQINMEMEGGKSRQDQNEVQNTKGTTL